MLQKINLKPILLHTLAIFSLIIAFNNLAFLYDIDLIKAYARNEDSALQDVEPNRIALFLTAKEMIAFLGLVLGIGISFILARKQKIAFWHIFIVLILSLVLFGSSLYEQFQWLSVRKYVPVGPVFAFLLNAFIFLCLGLFIFFSHNIPYLKTRER